MTQATIDAQAIAQFQLNLYLTEQSEQASHYEIDSVPDIFGDLYRVWGGEQGINLLGTFYQSIEGFWISQPCNTTKCSTWATDSQAVNAILAA
ncbi:hypothetical protein [Nostoc sp. FACHB-190]|uniref:hypothetical protein n=1 Tax=Nostoc sp. FACHB-190 TaxID=2692838 RepID=UPI0016859797|nr:hypothetical protein [Nostoc sp. FACHB-190]MBD2303042.1 hypothetical protein [Nostoc sp. FACHB-190]